MLPSELVAQLDRVRWPNGWRALYSDDPRAGRLLEQQLVRELGKTHALYAVRHATTCLARREDNDDVLFWIKGAKQPFALVHLTWGSAPGPDPHFPWTVSFTTLSEALASDKEGEAGLITAIRPPRPHPNPHRQH